MKSKLLILFLPLVIFYSCRQEIVPPSSEGNINEPVLTRTSNSFIFSINADKKTATLIDNTFLNTNRSSIFSVINDHSSGFVEVKIRANQNNIVYSQVFDNNTTGTFKIEGYQPEVLILSFNNFTGKVRITLTNTE